ncbi:ribonuclease III domain-containing protein [Luteolibacter sp. SL250]|uniref:ribonuclease III domain-containing protein n=1 Tax=Luteolibacter sp. SL250 TaxID=2995170 RepID=UPI002270D6EA|nr:ribonuclease III domain-containing protein [Luteolibacter sp. SL250]WAC19858.1 ribonuclease III domain-containing protein [Luteolibacter sp. SL250]
MSSKDEEIRLERANAWIGDAVLALFARQFVLRERNMMDGEWFTRMTSNEFLSAFGNPTRVEASIGKLFLEGGLDAAFAWMDAELVPLFRRQIAKRP